MIESLPHEPLPRNHGHTLALLLAIAIGAALRFMFINRPCLWGDEALVYWRTCGTYTQLLDCLREDGFAPLHYEAAWLLAQRFRPTPFVLRLLPALCGSLTVPAIYFLARQLLDRRAALLSAALAATSAFGFFYSRDAKMYGELWLFTTLNVACMLWWLRTGRSTAWLGWVAAGCLAAGIHADGLILPVVSPLLLLTSHRPRWTDALWLTLGLVIIVLGPAGYYGTFNVWNQRIEEVGWRASGLQWVDATNYGRSGPDMIRFLGSSLLIGWSYPIPGDLTIVPPRVLHTLQWTLGIILTLLALGVAPWPARWRPPKLATAQPPWRAMLWLLSTVVPIGYVFYCHSMSDFASPLDWVEAIVQSLPPWIQWLFLQRAVQVGAIGVAVAAGAALVMYRPTRDGAVGTLQQILVIIAMLGICQVLYEALVPMALDAQLADRSWHSLWVPRYLGFLWPMLMICVAALLLRLPTRPLRSIAIVLVIVANLAMVGRRMGGGTEPPVDQMAIDVVAAQPADSHTRTYTNLRHGSPVPGGGDLLSTPGRYYLQLLKWKHPMSPMLFQQLTYDFNFRQGYIPRTIADEAAATPRLDRIIYWASYSAGQLPTDDALAPLLRDWTRVSERKYSVTDYWDWTPTGDYLRREYVRLTAPRGK